MTRIQNLDATLEKAFGDFLDRLKKAGVDKFFHPHEFTETAATALCRRKGRDEYHVMLEGPRIVAYGMLRGWDEGHEIPSLGICTDPAEGRKGHAQQLMEHLIDTARRRNAKKIRLKVDRTNELAIALYRKFGFELSPLDDVNLKGLLILRRRHGPDRNHHHDQ